MKKILLVTGKEFILAQGDGGRKCTYRNYEILKTVYGEENVFVYIFTKEYTDCDVNIIRKYANGSMLKKIANLFTGRLFYSPRQEKELLQYIQEQHFDIAFFERSLFGILIKKAKKTGIEIQVFMENIEYDYAKNKVNNQSLLYYVPYLVFKYNEIQSLKYSDKIMCLTERDKDRLETIYGKTCDAIIPMTFRDRCEGMQLPVPRELKKELLFIGSLCPPNYNGIKWFVREVMPSLGDFHLYIIGKDFETKINELEKENITVIGTVDDLEKYYWTNRAMVMPIPYGDGIKVKTAEALMYGKVIFATKEALSGYDLKGIEGIKECNQAKEFVEEIRKFYNQKISSFSESVRQCFLEKYETRVAIHLYNTQIYEAKNK